MYSYMHTPLPLPWTFPGKTGAVRLVFSHSLIDLLMLNVKFNVNPRSECAMKHEA